MRRTFGKIGTELRSSRRIWKVSAVTAGASAAVAPFSYTLAATTAAIASAAIQHPLIFALAAALVLGQVLLGESMEGGFLVGGYKKCDLCGDYFGSESMLERHVHRDHSGTEK